MARHQITVDFDCEAGQDVAADYLAIAIKRVVFHETGIAEFTITYDGQVVINLKTRD